MLAVVDCGPLLDPENGMVTFNQSVFQSIAEYECDTGYTLEAGAASRTCGEGGVWSGAQPLCSRKCVHCAVTRRVVSHTSH